jgi:aspartate/methionine/tyrosine aminotransferase
MNFMSPEWPLSGTPHRISRIPLNKICDIADIARNDPDVVKLWIGEGDLTTPPFIRRAAIDALEAGQTRYTYSHGVPALREALSRYHKRHFSVDVLADRFSVTAGGVQAIMQAFQAILRPDDEVVVPVPAWPNLVEIIGILGGKVVPVPFSVIDSGRFDLSLADVFKAVTPKTRAIAINSPCNPTGWIMSLADMRAVLDFSREKGLWLISDEVYSHFTYGTGLAPSFLQIAASTDRLIVANTFSKNWCMTGWRMGWLVFPNGMSTIFDNLSQYNTTSVSTFSQYGAIAALDEGDTFISELVGRCAQAREIVCSALERFNNVRVYRPDGTFYLFFSVDGMRDSYEMALRILKQARVGVAPGSAFGSDGEGFLRICFAVDPSVIREGAARLARIIPSLSN